MNQKTLDLKDDQFESTVLESNVPVLVDFWAPWCGPCKAAGPILEELAKEYGGRVVIAKINTDEQSRCAVRYGVRGIPTLVLFRNGSEVDRVVGAMPKSEICHWLDTSIEN